MKSREDALADYRGRVYLMFTRQRWDAWECTVCGLGGITEQGRFRHFRWHADNPVLRLAKMHETVKALFG